MTGFIGSGKVKITCLKCGHKFSPGRDYDSIQKQNEKAEKFKKDHPVIFRLIMVGLFILMVVIVFKACSWLFLKQKLKQTAWKSDKIQRRQFYKMLVINFNL